MQCCSVFHDKQFVAGGVSSGSAGYGNNATQQDATAAMGRDSPVKGYQGSAATGQAGSSVGQRAPAGLDNESPVKGSTSAGQGTGLLSKDSPKAVSGECSSQLCEHAFFRLCALLSLQMLVHLYLWRLFCTSHTISVSNRRLAMPLMLCTLMLSLSSVAV